MSLNPEDTVICPYNKAHTIILSRLQFHIEKCRIQHPNAEKATCPFNATHIVNKVEMDFHLKWCQDRISGEREFFRIGGHLEVNPNSAPPTFPDVPSFVGNEVWGEEDVCAESSVLDKIREEVQLKPVLVNKICAPKAVRKQHKFDERRRFRAVTDNKTSAGKNDPYSSGDINFSPQSGKKSSQRVKTTSAGKNESHCSGDIGFTHQSEVKISPRVKAPKGKQEVKAQEEQKFQDEGKMRGSPWQGWKNVAASGIEESLDKIQLSEKSSSSAASLNQQNPTQRNPTQRDPTQRDPTNPWRTNQPPPMSSGNTNAADFPDLPKSGKGKRTLH